MPLFMPAYNNSMSDRDRIYAEAGPEVQPFEFSEAVAKVFPDMIERSVPGYRLLLELTSIVARRAVQPGSRVYDLGCSVGGATLAARRAIQAEDVEIVALDNAAGMVARCREVVSADNSRIPVSVIQADILEQEIRDASLVMMYFTLQFIPRAERDGLMARIASGMNRGGVLLVAEKLAFEDQDTQRWLDTCHHDFKRAQGYSDLEIARKRQALENVLVPETRPTHEARLKAAGFGQVIGWFQCFNFACIAAVR